jgi:hypothetical protein
MPLSFIQEQIVEVYLFHSRSCLKEPVFEIVQKFDNDFLFCTCIFCKFNEIVS